MLGLAQCGSSTRSTCSLGKVWPTRGGRPDWLTGIVRQVHEGDGFALHLVRDAAQQDVDLDLLRDVLVLVGRRLKHDGYLPVDVCLSELAVRLPRAMPEEDLYVVWRLVEKEQIDPSNNIRLDSAHFYSLRWISRNFMGSFSVQKMGIKQEKHPILSNNLW